MNELLYQVGKLAVEMGEEWRLQHAELMDAYHAMLEELKRLEGRTGL